MDEENNINPIEVIDGFQNPFKDLIDCLELLKDPKFINQSQDRKPKFKVGDVVTTLFDEIYEADMPYFIKEIIFINNEDGSPKYEYEAAMIDNPDKSYRLKESELIFKYHDANWAEYVTESVRANLPAWRGPLYNLYELYVDVKDHDSGFTEDAKDLDNHTIPPAYMEHILDRHTVYGRIKYVFASKANKELIMRKLNIREEPKLNKFVKSFREKVEKRNGIGYTKGDAIHFSPKEIQFAELIDGLDSESIGDGETQYVDHYKLDLRNKDIMKMIQQAYKRAQKVEPRVTHQTTKDRRTGIEDYQNLGKVDYEGTADDGTVIHIIYDFDVNVIDTAYPIKMNNNAKKH